VHAATEQAQQFAYFVAKRQVNTVRWVWLVKHQQALPPAAAESSSNKQRQLKQ
jgi:hypothetical protein